MFTKILKPLEKHWRYQGICVAVFLDVGWGIEMDSRVCSIVADAVRTDLFEAGFVTNEDKSVWTPCQRLDGFGITWDSASGTIEIVDRRVVKITSTIDSIIDSILFFLPEDWPLYRANNFYSACFWEHS